MPKSENMELDKELLARITKTPGAPGFEQEIRALIIKEIEGLVTQYEVDTMGSVLAELHVSDEVPTLMFAAHMDEIGFIVTHIDDEGFVRFHLLGGFDPKTLTSQRVIIHGRQNVVGVMGSKPIHVMKAEEINKAPKIEEFFIDTGMKKEDLIKFISVGDAITRERDMIVMGDCINAKSLDNRISVYILIEVLKALASKNLKVNIVAAFTTQEEVGIRGAINATRKVDPDYALAIDTTIAYDVPGAQPHEMITKLGEGTAIKVLDSSAISDYRMVSFLKNVATEHSIKHQLEILTGGGTDTMALQRYGQKGAIAGAVSIPTRHIHQVIEMVNKDDVINTIRLLTEASQSIGAYDWGHK